MLLHFLPHLNPCFLAWAQLSIKNQVLARQMTCKEHLKTLTYSTCKTTKRHTRCINPFLPQFLHYQPLIQHFCYSKSLHLLPWAIFPSFPSAGNRNNIFALTFASAASCAPLKSPILPLLWLSDPCEAWAQRDGVLCTQAAPDPPRLHTPNAQGCLELCCTHFRQVSITCSRSLTTPD